MRINPNSVPDILADLNQSQNQLNTLLQEVATNRSVNVPSDNPAAAAQMIQNTLESGNVDQYTKNISNELDLVQTASSVLSNVASSLTQAVSLGTEGANGTESSNDLKDLAQQVQGILTSVIAGANTSYEGAYIFGGTNSTVVPYTADSSSSTGYTYNGNSGTNSVEVGDGLSIQTNLPGSQVFSNSSNNVIGALSDLYNALTSGTSSDIASATSEVSSAISYLGVQQGFYANAETQLNSQQSFLQQDTVTLTTQQNNLVGVNEAAAATELSQAETENSAILAAAAKVLPNTLLNYLVAPS